MSVLVPEHIQTIGVFDSGVGGLTVLRALIQAFPKTHFCYLGDTARVPYGTKSPETVRRYADNASRFLVSQGAELIVIACNTASAAISEAPKKPPLLGVIQPGAEAAVEASSTKRIGVLGTEGTIQSGRYSDAIRSICPNAEVLSVACPLFVPLAEENLTQHPATRLLAEDYLRPMIKYNVDTLVLGCTHYPILRPVIESVMGPGVRVIDSAEAVARSVAKHFLPREASEPRLRLFATDASPRVHRVGEAFFGETLPEVRWIDLRDHKGGDT